MAVGARKKHDVGRTRDKTASSGVDCAVKCIVAIRVASFMRLRINIGKRLISRGGRYGGVGRSKGGGHGVARAGGGKILVTRTGTGLQVWCVNQDEEICGGVVDWGKMGENGLEMSIWLQRAMIILRTACS